MLKRKRMQKIKKYAKDFCDRVTNDYPKIIKNYPLIELLTYKDILLNGKYLVDGYFDHGTNHVVIANIYNPRVKELKQIIRHECLHFLLYNSGLPSKDDDILFTLLEHYSDLCIVIALEMLMMMV